MEEKIVSPEDGLYVDDTDGIVRDKFLEGLFDDFLDGTADELSFDNLWEYCKLYVDDDITKPDSTVISITECAAVWGMQFGVVTIWELDDEDFDNFGIDKAKDLRYGAKIGPIEYGDFAAGKTIPLSIVLAVVQMLREISMELNNRSEGQDALH